MDTAKNTEDNQIFYIVEFAHLPAEELYKKRQLLVCTECGGPAYFRKASKAGQAACFGARPHEPGCELANFDHQYVNGDGVGEEQDPLLNSGDTIVIDLNVHDTSESETKIREVGGVASRRRRGRFSGAGSSSRDKVQRRLSTLLRNLTETPFHESTQILEIEGHFETTVKDFFIPIEKVTNAHIENFRGLWGMLSCANTIPKGSLWLNGHGQDTINFCLDNHLIKDLFEQYGIEDEDELSGAYILVLGVPKLSAYDKLYCAISDLNHVALRLFR